MALQLIYSSRQLLLHLYKRPEYEPWLMLGGCFVDLPSTGQSLLRIVGNTCPTMQLLLLLQAFLRGESPPFNAYDLSHLVDISSSMSQEANVLEREVTNYWLAHYFRAEKESNPERTWKAMLLIWMRTVSILICPVHSCRV